MVIIAIDGYTLFSPQELEMIPYCNYKGIGVIAYAPLMTGFLARPVGVETIRTEVLKGSPFEKKLRESDKKIIGRVEELANKKGWSGSAVALAWVASKITAPIVGVNRVNRTYVLMPYRY